MGRAFCSRQLSLLSRPLTSCTCNASCTALCQRDPPVLNFAQPSLVQASFLQAHGLLPRDAPLAVVRAAAPSDFLGWQEQQASGPSPPTLAPRPPHSTPLHPSLLAAPAVIGFLQGELQSGCRSLLILESAQTGAGQSCATAHVVAPAAPATSRPAWPARAGWDPGCLPPTPTPRSRCQTPRHRPPRPPARQARRPARCRC